MSDLTTDDNTIKGKVEPAESPLPPPLRMMTYVSVTGASIAIIVAVLFFIFKCGC